MRYSESHEWVETHGEIGTVGVTQFAQKELGDIVYVELPKVGKKVKAGEQAAVLESTKAAADVYAPVSGKIVAVNEALATSPELVNLQPEGDGWLFKLELEDPKELDHLLDLVTYQQRLPAG